MQDYILLYKIKRGDPDAWETLVNRYYDQILAYCVGRCFGDQQVAADLTQDIFLKLIESIDRYHYTGKFFNYLFTIAVNTCHNYYNKKKIPQSELDEKVLLQTGDSVSQYFLERVEEEMLQEALNKLPDYQKDAVLLKFYEGLKVKDIAVITGVSPATAQSRIQQGLKKMEKMLDREEFGHDKEI